MLPLTNAIEKNKRSQLNPQMHKGKGGCPPPPTPWGFRLFETTKGPGHKTQTSSKNKFTVFTRISAAALINFFVRRLSEGGACLKIRRYKESSQRYIFHLCEKNTVCNRCVFSLYIHLQSTQNSLSPSITSLFWSKDLPSAVLDCLFSGLRLYGIPRISAASGTRRLFEGGTY